MENKIKEEHLLQSCLTEEPSTSKANQQEACTKKDGEIQYFQCSTCNLRVPFDYFGRNPSYVKHYFLLEDSYLIEDPFTPPKNGKIIVLGANCKKCKKSVCKDTNCSTYYDWTYCIQCAQQNINCFPKSVQEKLNRIVV